MRERLTALLLGALLIVPIGLLATGRSHQPAAPASAAAAPVQPSVLDDALGAAHAAAFTDATAALAIFDWADALPYATGRAHVRAACARLDPRQPLLAALADTCAPNLALAAVGERSRHGCRDDHRCATIMRSRARALRRIALSERALARAIRATIPAGPCRTALAPPGELIRADLLNSHATRRYAAALDHGDDTTAEAEHDTMSTAADIAERHAVYPRGRTISRACGLPATTFGNATT